MILSTHAIVGGAIASLFPSHPFLVAVAGFASHFAIDAIPHWDYPLRSVALGKSADNRRLKLNATLFRDVALVGLDACTGLALALLLFALKKQGGWLLWAPSRECCPIRFNSRTASTPRNR